ncbi:MAG: Crp/Fnr family transcriptional regulator [Actinobacteria bacterium]|jgi:CRP-like cAMP-binding protein|nr:Crp/Fnr family transcriptional regulator [Actinomycetota bacterium]
MAHEQVLADTEFFADAPASMLADVAASGKIRNLVRGDVLFEAGDDPDSIYVVLTGRIAIALGNRPFDHRESVIALMEEGDLFGEMGMLDKSARSAGARALETSTVLEIPYTSVLDQLNASTSLMWNVVRMLSRRLRAMDQALADSVFLDVTGRTAKRLVDLSGGKDEFMLPVTQEELAGMVGASRERVNKAIASFIKLHWLEQHDRSYRILDRAKLEQRAL